MKSVEQMPKQPITPLWIIALFVSLTEVVLGVAVVKTSGGVQVALTVFVIVFPVLIAGAFFLILWNRPYVLYPPTEYGRETDVQSFVNAMDRRSIDENTLANIGETVRSTLTSETIISELSRVRSSQVAQQSETQTATQISRILDSAVDKAVQRMREVNFLTIDSRLLLGNENGTVWQVPYEKYPHVSSLLDDISLSIKYHLLPGLLGRWTLRDSKTGQVFKDLGRSWSNMQVSIGSWADMKEDTRSLQEAGITRGMRLEVISA